MSDLDTASGFKGYAQVLRDGAAMRPFAAAIIGRLPIGMTSFGMVMLIQQVRGNYSSAGIVTGCFALSTAVGNPIWGRLMDDHGQPKVLVPTAVVSAAAIAAVALATVGGASNAVLIALAVVAGLFSPPLSPAMRAAWRSIYSRESARHMGYALDASAVEFIFVMGPLLLSLLAALFAPQVPLLVAAGLLAGGTLLYTSTAASRQASQVVQSESIVAPTTPADVAVQADPARLDRVKGTALTAPGVAVVLGVSSLMAVGFGQLDTSIISTAEVLFGSTDQLGLLFMFISAGSALGGIVYGGRVWPGSDTQRLVALMAAFAFSLVPWPFLLHLDHPPKAVFFVLLFCTGLTIAPGLIILQLLLDRFAPRHRMTEVQSLLSASQTTGGALGTAVAGFTVDAFHAPGGVSGACLALLCATAVAVVVDRRFRTYRRSN